MRAISRRLMRVLNSESSDPVEMLDLRLVASGLAFTKRLTNAGEIVNWRGYNYQPIAMSRGGFTEQRVTRSGNIPALRISIQNIDRQFAKIVTNTRIEGAFVKHWQTDRSLISTGDGVLLAQGELHNLSLSAGTGGFDIQHVFALIEKINMPKRIHQAKCNYRFGDQSCGVNLQASPNTITATALEGSTKSYVVVDGGPLSAAGNPDDPSEFWKNGSIWCFTGPNAPSHRSLAYVSTVNGQIRFYAKEPFRQPIMPGNTIKFVRGCGWTESDCAERQPDNTDLQHGGFPEVPYGRVRGSFLSLDN